MALVKFGGGIVQMSGSIAGTTFARNRFGNYARARTKPINPKSARQCGARIMIMMLAEQWREDPMTAAKREAWETFANAIAWNNKLGESIKLSGYNHFIRSNAALLAAGGTMVTDGPTILSLPPGDELFVGTASAATQKISVVFDDAKDWAKETGAFLSVQMGEPKPASRNFFGGPWRFAGAIPGVDTTGVSSPADIDPGFVLVEDQKIWIRARIIRLDGRSSNLFTADPFAIGA